MQKLYKAVTGHICYHEAWIAGDKMYEHRGVVGDPGETRELAKPKGISDEQAITAILKTAIDAGFKAIRSDDHATLIVEFKITGAGTKADIEKRHRLQDRLDGTLGWTGLGNCDGGSFGSGTMEVCCFVVDFEIAKRVIESDLAETEFADFSRIYDENA